MLFTVVLRFKTDSFRTGQRYGQITWNEMRTYRKALYQPQDFTRPESFLTKFFLTLCINGPFFGIPQTYLAHIKKASEFRGHIAGLRTSWESYTRQLVGEYSDFILIVSDAIHTSSHTKGKLHPLLTQATVLLSSVPSVTFCLAHTLTNKQM